MTPSGEINSGLKDLRDRAFKAYMKIRNDMGTVFNQNIVTTLSLIDTLVKPILLYAGDFWGCLKLPKNNPIENLHMMMCKHLLGVQKQTTNIGVLLELGRLPLHLYAIKFSVKNWERIKSGNGNKILLDSCNESIDGLGWTPNIKRILELNGMLNFYTDSFPNIHPFVHKKVFERLSDNFHQNSFESIKEDSSKLRTYAIFKGEIGLERYLTETKKVSDRILITKFRLSNHRLMIEVGRHNHINREMRFCPFCTNDIENECHFMFTCPTYTHLRVRYLLPITSNINNFQYFPHDRKMQMLLSDIEHGTGKYIANSMELRSFLTSKPKFFD